MMNSKLLDKLLIGSNLYRDKSINNLSDLLDEAAVEIQKLNVRLTFAQSYKADAERYRYLKSQAIRKTEMDMYQGAHFGMFIYDTKEVGLDKAIDQAMKEAKP